MAPPSDHPVTTNVPGQPHHLAKPLSPHEPAMVDQSLGTDQARTSRRVRNLERYLAAEVLRSGSFVCSRYEECLASHSGRFYEGQLHHVGRCYDLSINEQPLRVVVVGQEYGGGPPRVSVRERYGHLMISAHQYRFKADGQYGARNPHMRGTTSALRLLLGKGLGSGYGSEFIHFPNGDACHLFDAFALVNYLLCSAVPNDGSNRGRSTRTMRDNCAEHFRRTMEILEPTVVVVQGKGFGRYVERAFDRVEPVDKWLKRVSLGGTVSWLATFTHPCAHFPHNWGVNAATPYLLRVVRPTLERVHVSISGRSLPKRFR